MITARLKGGPLARRHIETELIQGRPPSTLDLEADDGTTCRYCLEGLPTDGTSAAYTFLYRV